MIKTSLTQNIFRLLLAAFMVFAGLSHLTINRIDFQAQVPDWVPLSKDLVVILSGIVEIGLGLGLAFWKDKRASFGWALALFFVLIFPGNISQYIDNARLIRLFFQPMLIVWALWSAGSWKSWRRNKSRN